jgi:hypothetical protein
MRKGCRRCSLAGFDPDHSEGPQMTTVSHYLWRRLDAPGHDACRFDQLATGYRLAGMAAFREGRTVCQLQYEVVADTAFRTRSARISGHLGRRDVQLVIRASRSGQWKVNGVAQPGLAGCIDLDLGFTPATNLLPIRRLALRVGQAVQVPTVYLDIPSLALRVIPQHYQRVSRSSYAYASPVHGYSATLQVSRHGAVESYPDVFELEKPR